MLHFVMLLYVRRDIIISVLYNSSISWKLHFSSLFAMWICNTIYFDKTAYFSCQSSQLVRQHLISWTNVCQHHGEKMLREHCTIVSHHHLQKQQWQNITVMTIIVVTTTPSTTEVEKADAQLSVAPVITTIIIVTGTVNRCANEAQKADTQLSVAPDSDSWDLSDSLTLGKNPCQQQFLSLF